MLRTRLAILIAALVMAGGTASCERPDDHYCDNVVPCPTGQVCNLDWRACVAAPDSGPADAASDAGRDARGLDDATPGADGARDAGAADVSAPDAGCAGGQHWCGDGCYPLDDSAHCGAGCAVCAGLTPACDGARCACSTTSCGSGQACKAGGCVPAECNAQSDCLTPPACHVATGVTCDNNICTYPLALDGSTCASGHCCAGSCLANDAAHCGPACLACQGETPSCDGTGCACTATSCGYGEVCVGGACVSGTCAGAGDCTSPPTCRTAAGATCNGSHQCVYPLASDGATCNGTDHCCSGSCVANDNLHCGASCGGCSGSTPSCDGTACVCMLTSCPVSTPICGVNGACRACSAHPECEARDGTKPLCLTGQCQPSVCGDHYTDTARGERCDDGNHVNGDGCDPTCRYTGTVTTIAGKAGGEPSHCDDTGSFARLQDPTYLAYAGGKFYFADTAACTIRQVTLPGLAVTTLAGSPGLCGSADGLGPAARFNRPEGVATDGSHLYVADAGSFTVRRVGLADGSTSTIAGAAGLSGSTDATVGSSARFSTLRGLALYPQALYVADWCSIRRIDLTGTNAVTTLAGSSTCGWADGTGPSASFNQPRGIAFVGSDAYVADSGNHCIRKITTSGAVTTPYGQHGTSGSADGSPGAATFNTPSGLAYSAWTGSIYVTEAGNRTVRIINIAGAYVGTLAGAAPPASPGFVDGTAGAARFMAPRGLAVGDSLFANDLFVADADYTAAVLRRVRWDTQAVTTLIGVASSRGGADGTSTLARFDHPYGVVAIGGHLLVADNWGCALRQLTLTSGDVVTFAGAAGNCAMVDGTGQLAGFNHPSGLTTNGALAYLTDTIALREIDPDSAAVATRAGGTFTMTRRDGDGAAAGFSGAQSVASDGTFLYVGESCAIRRVSIGAPWHVATIIGDDRDQGEMSCGAADGQGPTGRLRYAVAVTVAAGKLYVADAYNAAIRAVELSSPAQPYTITTVAGQLGIPALLDGVGTGAFFEFPTALAFDGQSLLVADREVVRQIDLSTMAVSTLTGRPGCQSNIDGDHAHAALHLLGGITYVPVTRSLVVTDRSENVVREVR